MTERRARARERGGAPSGAPRTASPPRAHEAAADGPTGNASLRERLGDRHVLGAAMVALLLVGIGASAYLAWTKLTGNIPVCVGVNGCETVEASQYSAVLGIPVAAFGLGMLLVVLAAVLGWLRTSDRRLLYVPYALGLVSLFVIAVLEYLQFFVIHAVCVWCQAFSVSVILWWIVSLVAMRETAEA